MREEFAVHMLNNKGKRKANEIATAFDTCMSVIEKHCPPGRLLAIVKTTMEQACFFAKKSMAIQPENHIHEPELDDGLPGGDDGQE